MDDGDEERLADRVAAYRELRSRTDPEALHSLIADRGLSILDRSVPYVLQALRWKATDIRRREMRSLPVDPTEMAEASPRVLFDPADVVASFVDLGDILDGLDDADVCILWWAAAGHSTREPVVLWDAAGLQPPGPSEAYVRKRLSLARQKARARGGAAPGGGT